MKKFNFKSQTQCGEITLGQYFIWTKITEGEKTQKERNKKYLVKFLESLQVGETKEFNGETFTRIS